MPQVTVTTDDNDPAALKLASQRGHAVFAGIRDVILPQAADPDAVAYAILADLIGYLTQTGDWSAQQLKNAVDRYSRSPQRQ